MKKLRFQDSAYSITWKLIHIVGFLVLVIILVGACCGFGMGPGLNPPLDIHAPTSEEIYLEQKEQHEGNADHLQPEIDPDVESECEVYIEYPDTFHSLI